MEIERTSGQAQGAGLGTWPKVAIIILNWNGWQDTIECLESVSNLIYPNYEVIVLDNGSTDDSIAQIISWLMRCCEVQTSIDLQDTLPLGINIVFRAGKITLIHSQENLGFAGGCNIGAVIAISNPSVKYLFFLNNDARLSPEAISEAVRVAEVTGADMIGSVILDRPGGNLIFAGSACLGELFWPTPVRFLFKVRARFASNAFPASMVPGSAMLLSQRLVRSCLASRGYLFNPILYLYGEEVDLGFWAQKNGFRSMIAPRSLVYHRLDVADRRKMSRVQYYLARNFIILGNLHLPLFIRPLFYVWHFLFRFVLILIWTIKGQNEIVRAIIHGLVDGAKFMSGKGDAQWRQKYQ